MNFKPKGICPNQINIELDGDLIKSVEFVGGCSGNTAGISSLVKGMKVDEAVSRMEGIKCGFKSTSCPDQLAQALKLAKTN